MSDFDILNIPIQQPKRKMTEYSYTIYGRAKFGKSSFASMFPNSVFFQFEIGHNALPIRPIPVSDWKEFKKHITALVKGKQDGKTIPYENFVIDTADTAYKWCTQYVCRQNGWSHPSDAEWGKGWQAVGDEWFNEMDRLSKLGGTDNSTTVIYIAHFDDKEMKPKNGEKYNKIIPSLPKGGRAVIVDKVDFIIWCDTEIVEIDGERQEVRRLYLRDNVEFEAGSRLKYMPNFIEFGDSKEEAFQNFRNAFEKAVNLEFGPEEGIAATPPAEPKNGPKRESKKASKPTPKVEQGNDELELGIKPEESEEAETIADLRKKLSEVFMSLYNSKKKSGDELVDTVKEYTGKSRINDIDDLESARKLLRALGA